jgi:hypothetical protein
MFLGEHHRMNYPKSFRKPPLWFRGINAAWRSSYALGSEIKLDKDDMIKAARKKTGLQDLGKEFMDEPLERLLRSINQEAQLHPIGRFITKERFVGLLSIRMRAEYYFRKYPEILDQPLYPAWIIVGLQRTGTTKLHRLLSCDPDHRVIPSWEVINPVPMGTPPPAGKTSTPPPAPPTKMGTPPPAPPGKTSTPPLAPPLKLGEGWVDPQRLKVAKLSVNALKYMSPGFFAIHPIDAHLPEEDILLLDVSFMSTTPEAMMQVPTYAQWLENTDQTPAYAFYVKMLKFLQWMNPAKRWVLKTPHHLEFIDLIEKNFEEVHFLWPHRTLYESVPSFLSMVTYNHMIFSDEVDAKAIGKHWVRKTGYMLDKALDHRLKGDNNQRFTDIYYKDLITDSEAEMRKIYATIGGLSDGLVHRFEQHEKEHPHRKHGTHNYSMGDFHLTASDIDHSTSRYQQFMKDHYGKS